MSGSSSGDIGLTSNKELVSIIHSIPAGECLNIHVSGNATDVDDDTKTISSKMLISNQYTKDINTNEIVLQILNDPNKVLEEPIVEDDNNVINPSNTVESHEETNNPSTPIEPSNNEETKNEINNNTPTNTVQIKDNNQTQTPDDNTLNEEEEQIVQKYDISGNIWLDDNKNGVLDDGETGISGIQIQLQKDNISIPSTTTRTCGIS